jgi:TonB family protein
MKMNNLLSGRGIFPMLIITILVCCAFTNPVFTKSPVAISGSFGVKKGKVIGKVTTVDGKPIERVTVTALGVDQKTVTDFQGTFILKSVPIDAELVFSFIGMKTVKIKADFEKLMSVQLEMATIDLPKIIIRPEEEKTTLFVASDEFGVRIKGMLDNKLPLFVLDGKEISKSEFNTLNADYIDQITLLKDSTEIRKYSEKGKNGVILITSKKIISTPAPVGKLSDIMITTDESKKEKKFAVAEQMPQFPGSESRMKYYFETYTNYPKQAKTDKLEGTVQVSFVISNTGKVEKVRVLKGIHPSLDSEVARVVSSMPYWKPGIQNDRPVDVNYSIPIEFSLKADK